MNNYDQVNKSNAKSSLPEPNLESKVEKRYFAKSLTKQKHKTNQSSKSHSLQNKSEASKNSKSLIKVTSGELDNKPGKNVESYNSTSTDPVSSKKIVQHDDISASETSKKVK